MSTISANTDSPDKIITQIIVQIIARIICEPKTTEENREDFLDDFLPDCPACKARSLTHSDWLTYLFKSVRSQSVASPVKHAEM